MLLLCLLAASLSTDALVAFITYGMRGIHISKRSALVFLGISGIITLIAGILGAVLSPVITGGIMRWIGFVILLVLGIIRLFDSLIRRRILRGLRHNMNFEAFGLKFLLEIYAEPELADADHGGDLSPKEAIPLALALSADGAAAGIAAATTVLSAALLAGLTLMFTFTAIIAGIKIGAAVKSRSPVDLSLLGGVVLVVLAFLRLI